MDTTATGHSAYLSGLTLIQRGAYAEALPAFVAATGQPGRADHAWFYAGQCHSALNAPSRARRAYRRALRLNPDHAAAARALSVSQSQGSSLRAPVLALSLTIAVAGLMAILPTLSDSAPAMQSGADSSPLRVQWIDTRPITD